MEIILHGGGFWPLQRTAIPGVLHIYALRAMTIPRPDRCCCWLAGKQAAAPRPAAAPLEEWLSKTPPIPMYEGLTSATAWERRRRHGTRQGAITPPPLLPSNQGFCQSKGAFGSKMEVNYCECMSSWYLYTLSTFTCMYTTIEAINKCFKCHRNAIKISTNQSVLNAPSTRPRLCNLCMDLFRHVNVLAPHHMHFLNVWILRLWLCNASCILGEWHPCICLTSIFILIITVLSM